MGRDAHDMMDISDDEFDFDEYFASTYRPLSNLPTPPLSSKNSFTSQSPQSPVDDGELVELELLGPAVHLVNMLPPAASLATPSVPHVQAILSRAQLPMDTIALAVCILDSLDTKFSRNWRLSCPLAGHDISSPSSNSAKRHTLPATQPTLANQLHIDSVCPEVIVVAALMIAVKFTEDLMEPTHFYARAWGHNTWTCAQLNVTERAIMESLHYRIMPLLDRDILDDAKADMGRAGANTLKQQQRVLDGERRDHLRSMSTGIAVTGLGLQITPVESPEPEDRSGMATGVSDETQEAFRHAATMTPGSLRLPLDR